MKPLLVLLSFAALCMCGAGCDKPEPQAAPEAFDEAIDGKIPLRSIAMDPSVLKERPRMELPQAPPPVQPAPEPAAAPAAGPMELVRQKMKTVSEEAMRGNVDPMIDALVPEQSEKVRTVIQRFDSLTKAVQRLREVSERVLGEDPFQRILAAAGAGPGQAEMPIDAAAAIDAQAMEAVSLTEVRFLDEQGRSDGSAHLIDGEWRLRMPDDDLDILSRASEHPSTIQLAAIVEQACTQLADALESGAVTSANFDQTVQAIIQQQVGPAMFSFMMAMQSEFAAQQPEPQPEAGPAEPRTLDERVYGPTPLPPNAYGPAGGDDGNYAW